MLSQQGYEHENEDYLMKFMRNRMENQQDYSKQDSDIQKELSYYETERYQNTKRQVRFDRFNQNEDQDQYNNESYQQQENYQSRRQSKDLYRQQDQQNKGNPCDDSFLNLVDNHLSNLQKQAENQSKQIIKQSSLQLEIISLSKKQVLHCLLENQTTFDVVQLTNLLPTKSIAQIINAPFQFKLLNAKNKFLKRDQLQIILEPYQSVQIQFLIKKRQNEIGNIYQTLRIDAFQKDEIKNLQKFQSKFLKFQITFVKPKLQVNFLGRTSVKRIQEHKIAHLQIHPNQMGQYCFNLLFSQDQFSTLNSSRLQKIQCQIETKGYVSIHPSSVILYQDQPLKIMLRRLTQSSGIGKTSVVLIKPLNSSLTYILGVKCLEKVEKSTQQQNFNKFNKLML